MKLQKFDEVQIRGLHPRNPVTGERIHILLQIFMLTRGVDGDMIPLDALHPSPLIADPDLTEPISTDRVVILNGALIHA
jgi:hypothetical protein